MIQPQVDQVGLMAMGPDGRAYTLQSQGLHAQDLGEAEATPLRRLDECDAHTGLPHSRLGGNFIVTRA